MQGKTNKQYKDSASAAAIGFMIIVIMMILIIISNTCVGQEIGYLVYIRNNREITHFNTQDSVRVQEAISQVMPFDMHRFYTEIDSCNYFSREILSTVTMVYVERKYVIWRNGKSKYRMIKR